MKLKRQKFLAVLLACALVVSAVPCSAFAEEPGIKSPAESLELNDETATGEGFEAEEDTTGEAKNSEDVLDNESGIDNESIEEPEANESEDAILEDEVVNEVAEDPIDGLSTLESEEPVILQEEISPLKENEQSISPRIMVPEINYQSHAINLGWQAKAKNGATAGKAGTKMGALTINLSDKTYTGDVQYKIHTSGTGWHAAKKNGEMAGKVGQAKPIRAISISLTKSQDIDIYYRVYISELDGWQGWAKNGKVAGSSLAYGIDAIQIKLVKKGNTAPSAGGAAYHEPKIGYSTHVQNVGWQSSVYDGNSAGTTGKSLRIEALRIKLHGGTGYSGGVKYQTHVQNVGWQEPKYDGALSGTSGRGLRIEALKISLTGEVAQHYDVYYRVHVQNRGWLNWASNGAGAGTENSSLRIEGIQIRLVKKGASAPSGSGIAYYPKATVNYKSNIVGIGWQAQKTDGATSGTLGKKKRIEALSMTLNAPISGGIAYRAYMQGSGWQKTVYSGTTAGKAWGGKRVEAITINLTGEAAKYYDVYYRVHVQEYGWLGWAKNGEKAGTATVSYRMEAIQIKVVAKGGIAPGNTGGAYKTVSAIPPAFLRMDARVSGKSSSTGWLLAIDTTNNIFGVYRGSRGNWTSVHRWQCATGLATSPTVKGTFRVGSKGYSFGSYYTCYYWTQFYNDYLIHSVKYFPGTRTILDPAMGRPASAGCVRLWIENAKWVQDNIPAGTTVYVY